MKENQKRENKGREDQKRENKENGNYEKLKLGTNAQKKKRDQICKDKSKNMITKKEL